jgi:putative chitinase
MLKIGSKGNLVKLLQEKLGVTADGDFGPKTESALKEWQSKNGLTADGVAGPITLSKMGIEIPIVKKEPLKLDKLKGQISDTVISEIALIADKFGIITNLRLCHFLAQCSTESGNFKLTLENLNYSTSGLMKIFPGYFPGNLAESYAHQPEKIASRVYGSRMGNGDETTKEGWKFRGRGFLQVTGKQNYQILGDFLNVDLVSNPDLVATTYPLSSAAHFFYKNNLWPICDEGLSEEVVTRVSRRVNGGDNGLQHRKSEFKRFEKLLLI